MRLRSIFLSILIGVTSSCAPHETKPTTPGPTSAPTTSKAERAGIAVYVNDELLTDYQPRSSLITKQTPIDKPKFDVVDIHCHWSLEQNPQALLKSMDELGETRAINLSGGTGDQL